MPKILCVNNQHTDVYCCIKESYSCLLSAKNTDHRLQQQARHTESLSFARSRTPTLQATRASSVVQRISPLTANATLVHTVFQTAAPGTGGGERRGLILLYIHGLNSMFCQTTCFSEHTWGSPTPPLPGKAAKYRCEAYTVHAVYRTKLQCETETGRERVGGGGGANMSSGEKVCSVGAVLCS